MLSGVFIPLILPYLSAGGSLSRERGSEAWMLLLRWEWDGPWFAHEPRGLQEKGMGTGRMNQHLCLVAFNRVWMSCSTGWVWLSLFMWELQDKTHWASKYFQLRHSTPSSKYWSPALEVTQVEETQTKFKHVLFHRQTLGNDCTGSGEMPWSEGSTFQLQISSCLWKFDAILQSLLSQTRKKQPKYYYFYKKTSWNRPNKMTISIWQGEEVMQLADFYEEMSRKLWIWYITLFWPEIPRQGEQKR